MLIWLAILIVALPAAQKPLSVQGSNQQQQTQTQTDETKPDTQTVAAAEVAKEMAANAERYAYYKSHPKEYWKAAFAPASASNWLLAVLGAVGGFLAYRTVLGVKKQATAQMNAARGWVLINVVQDTPVDFAALGASYTPGIVFSVEVVGTTPTTIIRQRARCRLVPAIKGGVPPSPDLETVPTYRSENGIFEGTSTYPPGYKYQLSVPLETGAFSMPQFADFTEGKTLLCAYACIDYLDAFGRKASTQVCAVYRPARGGVIHSPDGTVLNPPGFRVGSPKGYNRAT